VVVCPDHSCSEAVNGSEAVCSIFHDNTPSIHHLRVIVYRSVLQENFPRGALQLQRLATDATATRVTTVHTAIKDHRMVVCSDDVVAKPVDRPDLLAIARAITKAQGSAQ
jgi:hypothetical protein